MKHPLIFYTEYLAGKKQEKEKYRLGDYEYWKQHPSFNRKNVLRPDEFSTYLQKQLIPSQPFMVSRFGANELACLRDFDFERTSKEDAVLKNMAINAGFFPADAQHGKQFAELMKAYIPSADIMAIWPQPFESYYLKHYGAPDLSYTWLRCLSPWENAANPWTKVLCGKKVLVIHPFAESIQSQYLKREKIWPGTEILPEFQLETFKAVQTSAGEKDSRFHDWFEALKWMEEETLKKDVDIALIGCGAYGMPLAAELKRAGKEAIHLGGVIQILFGIMGSRWENDPIIQKYRNSSWIRPLPSETPKGSDQVEHSCYW